LKDTATSFKRKAITALMEHYPLLFVAANFGAERPAYGRLNEVRKRKEAIKFAPFSPIPSLLANFWLSDSPQSSNSHISEAKSAYATYTGSHIDSIISQEGLTHSKLHRKSSIKLNKIIFFK
jgi:hypothetical protein